MDEFPRVFLVGGTFNHEGGRPSGYFRKLRDAVLELAPGVTSLTLNGGSYEMLEALAAQARDVQLILWFADVPNEFPKLLPGLKARFPKAALIQSKNNRRGAYTREQLVGRLAASHACALVEFTESAEQRLRAAVIAPSGDMLLEPTEEISQVALAVISVWREDADKARQS